MTEHCRREVAVDPADRGMLAQDLIYLVPILRVFRDASGLRPIAGKKSERNELAMAIGCGPVRGRRRRLAKIGKWVHCLGFLVCIGSAQAQDWTREDTYRQATVSALLLVDWGQTRWIAKNGYGEPQIGTAIAGPAVGGHEDHYEINPLLGRHPGVGKINNYFAAALVGHTAISYALPPPWRQGWQYVWIGVEGRATFRNSRAGIKIGF